MKSILRRESGFALLGFAALLWTGCAGIRPVKPGPIVAADSKQVLYVALPTVPDSVESLLARLGWGSGRFAQELRKEVAFQLNRKGVPIVEDSAAAKSTLSVDIGEYVEGGGSPSRYAGSARLKTPSGERGFKFAKASKRAEAPERPDPTVDNIRLIAGMIVAQATKDPNVKKEKDADFNPQIMMIF